MKLRSKLSSPVLLSTLATLGSAYAAPPPQVASGTADANRPNAFATSSADLAAAEALFQEARKMLDEGRYGEACPRFEESQRLDPAVGTLLYLAACYEANGQTASAWATFELAAAEGRKANQTNREKLARERAAALAGRLSKLSIVLDDAHRVDGVVIRRDDTELRDASLGVAVPVDPGRHTVYASAPGHRSWSREVEVGPEKDLVTVDVPLLEPLPAESSTPTADAPPERVEALTPPADPQPHARFGTQRIVGLAVGGLGVVGVGAATWMFLDAHALESDSEEYCEPPDYTSCDSRGMSLLDDARGRRTLGYVFGGAGLAALAAGTVLYFTAPTDAQTAAGATSVVPLVSGRFAGVGMTGTF